MFFQLQERPKETTNYYGGLHLHYTCNIVTDEGKKKTLPREVLTPGSFCQALYDRESLRSKGIKGLETRLLSPFTVPLCFALNIVEETSW